MSAEFFEFPWLVSTVGYEWITARYVGQENPPGELTKGASEDEKLLHRLTEQASLPKALLIDTVPIAEPSEKRITFPLRDLFDPDYELYREFAGTPSTPDGILEFANRHGLLGCDLQREVLHTVIGPEKFRLHAGETIEDWTREITAMSEVVDLWDMAAENRTGDLNQRIHRGENGITIALRGPKPNALDGQPPTEWPSVHWITITPQNAPGQIFDKLKPGDLRTPALLAVQRVVNKHLSLGNRTASRLLWNVETQALEYHVTPTGLIGAIWLDLALAINGKIEYRLCDHCGNPFAIKPKARKAGGAKNEKRYCSRSCRFKQYRARKKAAAAAS